MILPGNPFDINESRIAAQNVIYMYSIYKQWEMDKKPNKQNFILKLMPPAGKPITPILFGNSMILVLNLIPDNNFEPFAVIIKDVKHRTAYLVFRGTISTPDWVNNANYTLVKYLYSDNSGEFGRVHEGFYIIYNSIRYDMLEQLTKEVFTNDYDKLIIAGHSLGAALSTLSIPDIDKTREKSGWKGSCVHYSYAAPRTGNIDFARKHNRLKTNTYRVVNSEDIVPRLPTTFMADFQYEHVGIDMSYTAQYGSFGGNHSMTDAYFYAMNHPDAPKRPF